jgi:tetratricopeptide (TPR) repeat protein
MAGQVTASVAEALRHAVSLLQDDPRLAATKAREILQVSPNSAHAYRLLGAALRRSGDVEEAEAAELQAISASVRDPALLRAAEALLENDLPTAEQLLRARLKGRPTDVAAIRMMAELAGRLGRFGDSEKLLRRALELAPAFAPARANLATVLYRQNRPAEAIEELDRLQAADAAHAGNQNLKAAALGRVGSYEEAIGIYEQVLVKMPRQPKVWMSYGHALKTVGRQEDSLKAYRQALAIAPTLGEVWWSLANLKTVPFSDEDVAAMEQALGQDGLTPDDRLHLHFALGKALEQRASYDASFAHYSEGNRLRSELSPFDYDDVGILVQRSKRFFTPAVFASRADDGCQAADPIFILGMPRSGSTLVEQILASHSMIEGTMELPDMPALAKRIGGGKAKWGRSTYPECLAELPPSELRALGEEYLERTRIQRKTDRPFFIDKMPNNWLHVGFIRLILPNARIIDARRHPLDCCFSNFKQHYARGQGFSYSLEGMGRYYSDYVELMAHFDDALACPPARVIHERLVDDPEGEIRHMLSALALPFEARCLDFHSNKRAVRTASSEQVRRPINREGVGQWKPYDRWLGPLKQALGQIADAYPEVPGR